jgi:hypothetical protein
LTTFSYGAAQLLGETPTELNSVDYYNGSNLQQSQTLGDTRTTTHTCQTTVTDGVSTQASKGIKVTAPGFEGSAGVQVTTSFSTSQQQTESSQQTWNCTTPILVPPKTGIRAVWSVTLTQYNIPFAGTLEVHGHVHVVYLFGFDALQEDVPVGRIFRVSPSQGVEVIDEESISCHVSGVSNILSGTNLQTTISQYTKDADLKEIIQSQTVRNLFRRRER